VTALNAAAKAALRDAGVSQAAWARERFGESRWHGGACGCTDDRCIGFHHDEHEECGCLPVLLASYLTERAHRARVSGPYDTERDAIRDSLWYAQGREGDIGVANRTHLMYALSGVALGAHDRRILDWLAGYEPSTVAVICGLISRARAQGGTR
jgi:hypothetical protein